MFFREEQPSRYRSQYLRDTPLNTQAEYKRNTNIRVSTTLILDCFVFVCACLFCACVWRAGVGDSQEEKFERIDQYITFPSRLEWIKYRKCNCIQSNECGEYLSF